MSSSASLDDSPLASARSDQSKAGAHEVRARLQRVYLEGLDYLRGKIQETENELERVKLSYYQCEVPDEDLFEDYLKRCDGHLLHANNELRRSGVKLEVLDAETKLVALLNRLRENENFDQGVVDALTEYWENVRTTTEALQTVVSKFQSNVLNRLKLNCTSYNDTEISLDVSYRYTEDISSYLTTIERILNNTQLLIHSYGSGLHQDLFDDSKFSKRILVSCDLKAFPLLRFVEDVGIKLHSMFAIARQWLQRDEQYMYEINDYIRETRSITRRREEALKSQKEKQKKFEKSIKAANILLQNNREKLTNIETELVVLEGQLDGVRNEKKSKYVEKQQKESMVDFLKLTLAQTKRNYSLQMKRSKLLKQVKDLEQVLSGLERDLSTVQDQIVSKAQQKVVLEEKVSTTQKSYNGLCTDMDKLSDNLEKLESDVNSLSGQLLQLEIIQTFKTSPEKIDEIYDRPSTVKLSPSLKEKIKQRKRRALARAQ